MELGGKRKDGTWKYGWGDWRLLTSEMTLVICPNQAKGLEDRRSPDGVKLLYPGLEARTSSEFTLVIIKQ